ncbi:METAL-NICOTIANAMINE TRANSPORTER YSL7-RELATED [Salix viminalis]|uniref:METAL-NICOTIANAMINE TRANSPORTER YSL7-RELATED n=1 Tax=Salix viminalis TaxID=40686 RepID=A0A9Q0ZJT6_SALVM|nr:METAL-NICOTIANAMINE TRANSPORTER YSL7-RELATED [Salix viminalis]
MERRRGGGGDHGENYTNPFDGDDQVSSADEKEEVAVEEAFKDTKVPSWGEQITFRAMLTSLVLSIVFNFIVCKLNLTTGVIPSLNVAAGLLGFAILRFWTSLLGKAGFLKQPFTRQENTVVQTCVVASSGIAFSNSITFDQISPSSYTTSTFGSKSLVLEFQTPLMILKYKLTYPSGTATAYLINSFHTPKGAKLAKKQVSVLFKYFAGSFLWAGFQWFWTAADGCGFASFPTFGPQAFARRFYFDFSATYVGVGMICPYMVNISLLLGAILSWGILWPIIETKKGDWYSADAKPSSLHGIQGYRVFMAIATMLGDGLFHVIFMLSKTIISLIINIRKKESDQAPGFGDENSKLVKSRAS